MRSVGLMGYARSGKDTAGAHLVGTHGYRRVGFADGVRDSLLALDPIVDVCLDRYGDDHRDVSAETLRLSDVVDRIGWESAKDRNPEIRALLQRMGTEAVRDVIGADAWTRLARWKINAAHEMGRPVVVTDVRFPNEMHMLREAGFRLVWVLRPGYEPVNGHSSETGVSAADAHSVLYNDADVDELCAQIEELAE